MTDQLRSPELLSRTAHSAATLQSDPSVIFIFGTLADCQLRPTASLLWCPEDLCISASGVKHKVAESSFSQVGTAALTAKKAIS